MKNILLTGLAIASICSVNSYGPPPTKNKHRTTTTTLAPLPDANSPVGNSVYSTGPGIDHPSGCGSPGGGCGLQTQYPGAQTVRPGSGTYSPGQISTSSASSGGSTYWWQSPNSPFNPNQTPGPAPVQPQYPGSNQPGPAPSAPHQPGSTGLNQPESSYPGSSQPDSAPASQPIDVSKNPFLSSALGISKPSGCGSSSAGGCGAQPQYPGGQQTQPQYPGSIGKPSGCSSGCGQTQYPSGQGQPQYPGQPSYPGSSPVQPQYPAGSNPQQPGSSPQYPGSPQGQPQQPGSSPQYPGSPQGQPHQPGSSPQYPGSPQGQPQQPGSSPQYPGSPQGQPHQPGSSPQYPGSPQGQPHQPGSSPQYPGSPQGQPQQPGSSPQYPGSSQGQPQQPGSSPQYPGSPQGQPHQPGSSPQYPGSSQGQPQQPGSSPQYPGSPQGQPQQPGSSPQYPGSQTHPQYPGTTLGQTPQTGYPQGGYPNYPGSSPSQYPGTPSGQPQYPQYGSGSNSIPSGDKFPPPYPGANAQAGQSCNAPNHLCVAKSACYQGVLSQNGVPGRAGICNSVTEVCCRIPTNPGQGSQPPPSVGYGNGHRPGTNGIPIGGSIYDNKPSYVTPSVPVQPYTGPLNTTPYPGCPAALKCVSISYCTAEGVMSDSPVYLTREQQESRVPLTDCMNPDTNVIGKCCRDPNYKDPWPAGMMMNKTPTGPGGFDDGQYHPEQEASNTFSHEAGIYYNVVSTTPKGHTIKKPIGNFNQKPTPFPTKPSVPVSPGRQPAPVYENTLPERGDTPDTINTPSNEILPPQPGQPSTGYNQIVPSIPGKQSVTVLPQQPGQTGNPTVPGTGPAYQPQSSTDSEQPGQGQTHTPSGQNTPTYGFPQGQTTSPNQPTLGQGPSGYQPSQSTPGQPGQPGLPTTGYQPAQSTPGHQGQPNIPSTGYQPNQSGQSGFPTTGYQPSQSSPGQGQPGLPTTGQQPGQQTIGQPDVTLPGNQPSQPGAPGYQPGQTTVGQGSPTSGYQQPSSSGTSYQPSGKPNQVTPGYQPTIPNLPDQPSQQSPSSTFSNVPTTHYPSDEENYSTPSLTTYTPRGHQAGQPSQGFVAGQIAPGSSCGVRHQAFSNNREEAGITEFPWQALITSAGDKKFLCGGAIVSNNAVITAAHCIENFRAKDLVIKVGVWKLLSPNEAEQIRPVAAIARHPKYDAGSLAEDLAILVVSVSFNPTEHVDKICLPKTIGYRPQNSNCVVTGWGRPALKGPIPNSILHKVDVSFMDNARCEETLRATHLGKYFILNKGFSCALPKSSSDLCKVDVGGPLACDRGDGHYELAGVNSWDVGCPAEQTPTVFSNPDAEWIQNTINTPISKLEQDEEQYNVGKLKGESLDQVDIDQKPGFALGYGK